MTWEIFQPSTGEKQMPFPHLCSLSLKPLSAASCMNSTHFFQCMEEMDGACALGIALNLILTQFLFAGLTLLNDRGP